jgi:hypothetical protein
MLRETRRGALKGESLPGSGAFRTAKPMAESKASLSAILAWADLAIHG